MKLRLFTRLEGQREGIRAKNECVITNVFFASLFFLVRTLHLIPFIGVSRLIFGANLCKHGS